MLLDVDYRLVVLLLGKVPDAILLARLLLDGLLSLLLCAFPLNDGHKRFL